MEKPLILIQFMATEDMENAIQPHWTREQERAANFPFEGENQVK